MAYSSFLRGKSSIGGKKYGAVEVFVTKFKKDCRKGIIKMIPKEQKEVIRGVTEAFVKNGKDPYKIREKKFEEVLNRFARNKKDLITPKDVKKIEERYDIEHRTNKINRIDIEQKKNLEDKSLSNKKVDKFKNFSEMPKQERSHYKTLDLVTYNHERIDQANKTVKDSNPKTRRETFKKPSDIDIAAELPPWKLAAYDNLEAPASPSDIDE